MPKTTVVWGILEVLWDACLSVRAFQTLSEYVVRSISGSDMEYDAIPDQIGETRDERGDCSEIYSAPPPTRIERLPKISIQFCGGYSRLRMCYFIRGCTGCLMAVRRDDD